MGVLYLLVSHTFCSLSIMIIALFICCHYIGKNIQQIFCQSNMLHKDKKKRTKIYLPFSKKSMISSGKRYSRGFLHSISSINLPNNPLCFAFDFFDCGEKERAYTFQRHRLLFMSIRSTHTFDFFESIRLCSHSLQNHLSLRLSRSFSSIGGSTHVKWNAFGQASQQRNWPAPPHASQRS